MSVSIRPDCIEDVTTGHFSVVLTYIVGACLILTDFTDSLSVTGVINSTSGTCIFVPGTISISDICYTATLMYQNTLITTLTNIEFQGCLVSSLKVLIGSDFVFSLNREVDNSGRVPHITTATLRCANSVFMVSGNEEVMCRDGVWDVNRNILCSGNK